jgi:hypothetical protein
MASAYKGVLRLTIGFVSQRLAECNDVSRYYAGFEAKARYGLLLLKQGG